VNFHPVLRAWVNYALGTLRDQEEPINIDEDDNPEEIFRDRVLKDYYTLVEQFQ